MRNLAKNGANFRSPGFGNLASAAARWLWRCASRPGASFAAKPAGGSGRRRWTSCRGRRAPRRRGAARQRSSCERSTFQRSARARAAFQCRPCRRARISMPDMPVAHVHATPHVSHFAVSHADAGLSLGAVVAGRSVRGSPTSRRRQVHCPFPGDDPASSGGRCPCFPNARPLPSAPIPGPSPRIGSFAGDRGLPAVLGSRLASLPSPRLGRSGVLALCLWRFLLLRAVA